MMKRALLGMTAAFGLWAGAALAAEQGTADEAKVLAEKAAAHVKAVGPKALADFDDPNGGFMVKDLFVVVYDSKGVIVSAGGNKALIGKDATKFRDTEGKAFGQEILDTATKNGSGWVDYSFLDPATKKVRPKSSYAVKAGEQVVFVGYYK
ncbi:cache domain-containing protein [Arenibaculum pallidiluteum]|uniref:cache domain-containing protein n=1 Tax=Arenibaculum pallidiluteum TaxID=2812559 RepID=UPI001A959A6C|nr:cache domain-containing protein [Arenibaculum pallidiluteum]